MNRHDTAFQEQKLKEFDEALTRENQARSQMTEKEKFESTLNEFNTANNVEITEEILEFDVPPRLKAKYENKLTPEFLAEAKEYLQSAKVIEMTEPPAAGLGGVPPAAGTEIKTTVLDSYDDFGA